MFSNTVLTMNLLWLLAALGAAVLLLLALPTRRRWAFIAAVALAATLALMSFPQLLGEEIVKWALVVVFLLAACALLHSLFKLALSLGQTALWCLLLVVLFQQIDPNGISAIKLETSGLAQSPGELWEHWQSRAKEGLKQEGLQQLQGELRVWWNNLD